MFPVLEIENKNTNLLLMPSPLDNTLSTLKLEIDRSLFPHLSPSSFPWSVFLYQFPDSKPAVAVPSIMDGRPKARNGEMALSSDPKTRNDGI